MNETLNIQNGVSPITIDTEVTEGSTRPVMGGGIYEAIAGMAEPFVVELTPTAVDLTEGTMDKTTREIYEAWHAGKIIEFRLAIAGVGTTTIYCNNVNSLPGYDYPAFEAVVLQSFTGQVALSWIETSVTSNADNNSWYATHYPLTSA